MKAWDQRPFEIRNLFNPAFCAVLLLRAMQAFEEEDAQGMPFSLSLVVLPLCLHKDTRNTILKHSRSYFLKAVAANPQMLVGLADRATNLLPYTFEALGFAMQLGCFEVTPAGRLRSLPKCVRKSIAGTSESIECQRAARNVGKEFGAIGDRVTIYVALGIRP